MDLKVRDRIFIGDLLPKEGDIMTMTIRKDVLDKTKLTQKDMVTHKVKNLGDDKITWNEAGAKPLRVTFSGAEMKMLKEQVAKLDSEKKVTEAILDLCSRIKDYSETKTKEKSKGSK